MQQVFSIELVQFSIPLTIAPTWIGRVSVFQAILNGGVLILNNTETNTLTDIRITSEDGLSSDIIRSDLDRALLTLFGSPQQVTVSGFTPDTLELQRILLEDDIQERFALLTGPVINDTNYEVKWIFLNDLDKANALTTMVVENKGTPGSYASVEFLYGTGANKDNQTSRVWGFPPDVDSTPTASPEYGARPSAPLQFSQFRYININIEEAPEFKPICKDIYN